jgi:collagenase-like PrtC family protease
VDRARQLGVEVLRISPQSKNTLQVIKVFEARMEHVLSAREAATALEELAPASLCNGYWYGKPGHDRIESPL